MDEVEFSRLVEMSEVLASVAKVNAKRLQGMEQALNRIADLLETLVKEQPNLKRQKRSPKSSRVATGRTT